MNTVQAQAIAQLLSVAVFLTIARWYFVPWTRAQARADALIPLLWIHVFRYVALQAFSAQQAGFPISDAGRDEIVLGDLMGAFLAMAAIVALRHRARTSIPLVYLLVAETLADTVKNVSNGVHEHLIGRANGVTWLVLAFYVPMILVSLGLVVWQLYARRGEPLASEDRLTPVSRRASASLTASRSSVP
jgi:hypothetical protein